MHNLFVANARAHAVIQKANPAAKVGANPLLLGLPHWLQDLVNANAMRRRATNSPPSGSTNMPSDPLSEWGPPKVVFVAIAGTVLSVLLDIIIHGWRRLPGIRSISPNRGSSNAAVPSALPGLLGLPRILIDLVSHPRQYSIILTLCLSNWWQLGMAGKLPAYLCPPECQGKQDFVGFDYYWGTSRWGIHQLIRLYDAMIDHFDLAPVCPTALYEMLKHHMEMFPNLSILIVENGCVESASGVKRATYIKRHLSEVQRAINDGVNILGYICWSITSNREWGLPFKRWSDFGLYHIELDSG
jgi:hypothetical protein